MTAYAVRSAKHGTLTAAAEDTVTLSSSPRQVEVYADTATIWFTADGTPPTVRGDDVYACAAGSSVIVDTGFSDLPIVPKRAVTVRLLSASATDYSVTAAA